MAQEAIIDLDRWDPEPLDEVEWPPRPDAIGRGRLIGLAVLALMCLAGLGRGAPAPDAALSYLGTIVWPGEVLRQGRTTAAIGGLVVTEIGGVVFAHHTDGRRAWQSRSGLAPSMGPRSTAIHPWEDGILLVQSTLRLSSPDTLAEETTSVALDPATGRERWRMRGQPERVGDLVMIFRDGPEGGREMAVHHRLPDGLLWTMPVPWAILPDGRRSTLMALTEQGIFTEYDLSTGKPRRTTRLPLPGLDPAKDQVSMQVFRDRLTVRVLRPSGPGSAVPSMSYDLATLRPLAASPLDRFSWLEECGPVVCASADDRTYLLDKDSLTELWRTRPREFPEWTGGVLLLRSGSVRLLDPLTGLDRLDVSAWSAVYDLRPPSPDHETLPLLATQQLDDRTFVARVTPDGVRVLGSIPQRISRCEHHERLLICGLGGDRTGIWRVSDSARY